MLLIAFALTSFIAQGHGVPLSDNLKSIAFLKGDWKGKQDFNTNGGPTMVGDAADLIQDAIGGRYLEERLTTVLPGRSPSDTRHFITFDPKANKFKAWWFNDASVGAMQLEGISGGTTLVLMSLPNPDSPKATIFRATYQKISDSKLDYTLEIKAGDSWQKLFRTEYSKG
jgi:Protein of unknown function (DUF1579)